MCQLIETCVTLGLAVAVFSFGGTEPVSFAIVETIFFSLAASLALFPPKLGFRIPLRAFAVPAALCAIVLLQLCPVPTAENGWKKLSIAPYATRNELLILLTCFIAFYAARLLGADRARRRRLILSFVVIGTLDAFYGLIQYLSGSQRIFGYVKRYDLEEVTGTYINRNHFAGLMEIVLPFAVALVLQEYGKLRGNLRGHTRRKRLQALLNDNVYRLALPVFVAAVLFLALVFSRSRMGILCSGCSLAFMFVLFQLRQKVPRVLLVCLIAVSLCLIVWIGPGTVMQRFGQIGQEYSAADGTRLSIWRASMLLIRDHPFLGTGLGTFPIAFTSVQDSFLGNFVNHAHNDYIELASDLGIPGAALLVGSIFAILIRSISAFAAAERRFDRLVALAASAAIVAIALHSLADFNLYIPANALIFSVVLGLARPPERLPPMQGHERVEEGMPQKESRELVSVQLAAGGLSHRP